MTINKLATESGVAPSTIKNILYGKSQNPGIVTLKMLCDGLGITLTEFFNTKEFENLEQEIKQGKRHGITRTKTDKIKRI